jgi:hypothetical protein
MSNNISARMALILFTSLIILAACIRNPHPMDLMEVSFVNLDSTSRSPDLPLVASTNTWTGNGWRGEKISTQLLIWSPKDLQDMHFSISGLDADGRNQIGKEHVQMFQIQYVKTDEFAEGCDKTGIVNYDSSLLADALMPLDPRIDLKAKSPLLLWLSVQIPPHTSPGIYQGSIIPHSGESDGPEITFNVEVSSWELPPPKHWEFHLDLWQNPYAEARYHQAEPWSEEHFRLMKPTLELLADAGQKCITTTITDLPWNGQTFDPFQSMIKKVRHKEGGWSYDYSRFDAWVEFAMSCGITEQINCYSMVSWSNAYGYYDESLDRDTSVSCLPGSSDYLELWTPFLKDFYEHLVKKGWEDITTISMDERSLDDLKEVLRLVKKEAPGLKIAFAGHYHPELDPLLFDLSVASKHVVPLNQLEERKKDGSKTTFYVCCVEERPNTFTFSNPAEASFLPWYAAYRQFDGLLRWSYNSWTRSPFEDSRFRRFPAGDTYIVYPGGVSSIRFERLREGIQDYEKIRILRTSFQEDASEEANNKLLLLENTLSQFDLTNLETEPAALTLENGKTMLIKLSEW